MRRPDARHRRFAFPPARPRPSPRHERDVAVKVLPEDLSASLGAGRFLREIKIAAQLEHPHILGSSSSGEAASLHPGSPSGDVSGRRFRSAELSLVALRVRRPLESGPLDRSNRAGQLSWLGHRPRRWIETCKILYEIFEI